MFDTMIQRRFTRRSILAGLGATAALPILAACQPQIIEVEKIQVVEKEVPIERVVTQVIEKEVERVVTVQVDRPVEVEKLITVEVEKAIVMERSVDRVVTVEVEKEVEVVREVVVEKPVEVIKEVERVEVVEVEVTRIVQQRSVRATFPTNNPRAQSYYLDDVASAWKNAFPHITLDMVVAPYGEWSTKHNAMIASDTAPTVWVRDDTHIWGNAHRGNIREITSYVLSTPPGELDDLHMLKATVDSKGRHWSIPRNIFTTALVYNEKTFEEAGVAPPTDNWKRSDFEDAAKAITTDINGRHPGDEGFDKDNVDIWGHWARPFISSDYMPLVYQFGGNILKDDEMNSNWDSPEVRDAFEWLLGTMHSQFFAPTPRDHGLGAQDAHLAGKIAMSSHLQTSESYWPTSGLAMNAVAYPQIGGEKRATTQMGHQFMIYAKDPDPDAGWEFIKWHATTPEIIQGIFTKGDYGLPALRTLWDQPVITEHPFPAKNLRAFIDPMDEGWAIDHPRGIAYDKWVWAIAFGIWMQAWEGAISLDDALAEIHEKVQVALDEAVENSVLLNP